MKSGKEVCINCTNKNFKSLAGAVMDYKSPKSIYLNISSWVKLKEETETLDRDVRELGYKVKMSVLNYLENHPIFDDVSAIVDFELSTLGLKNGQPGYLSVEVNLIQKNPNYLPLIKLKRETKDDLIPYLEELVSNLTTIDALNESNLLKFSKTKPKK